MGQIANGLLYGAKAPKLKDPTGDGQYEAAYGLVSRWEKAQKIDWLKRDELRVRIESEGGELLVGVWVSCGGSGEDGTPYFVERAVAVDDIERVYKTDIARAKKLWDRFRAWAANTERVKFQSVKLWITPCETA